MGLPVVSEVAWQVCIWNADITKWWVESYQSLGVGGRQFDELVTVVDTVGCLDDNLWCHQWWRGCRTGDVLLSVMVILNMFFLYVYFVSGCNKAFIYLSYLILPQHTGLHKEHHCRRSFRNNFSARWSGTKLYFVYRDSWYYTGRI